MSELTKIYGCIEGAFGSTHDWNALYLRNQEVIKALPLQDTWPPLVRSMFAVPMPGNGSIKRIDFYRIQMIHFGASFNHFADVWSLWLAKFESLLKQLYWHRVQLHLSVELYGAYEYLWEVSSEVVQGFYTEAPTPPQDWCFTGGPRSFEQET